ncbi:hypothetical protein FIBSPDRAFT_939477 [Athelia psychrophila]|uniref:Uncharacterized protein n=1 Tax=Athelia psychrophila TaxID=1759441 RepID=A0A167XSS2_9AGAM|nr:hypothetical protein FIBSPDRAFT_939477 [Fibularhizoctonia sp. CBS 109695]
MNRIQSQMLARWVIPRFLKATRDLRGVPRCSYDILSVSVFDFVPEYWDTHGQSLLQVLESHGPIVATWFAFKFKTRVTRGHAVDNFRQFSYCYRFTPANFFRQKDVRAWESYVLLKSFIYVLCAIYEIIEAARKAQQSPMREQTRGCGGKATAESGSGGMSISHGQNVFLTDAKRNKCVFAGFGVPLAPKTDPKQLTSPRQKDVLTWEKDVLGGAARGH